LGIWELGTIVSVRRHGHGLNSATWMVATETDVWIAKAVLVSAAAQFTAGLTVAAHLEAAGLRAGAPRPNATGSLSAAIAGAQVSMVQQHLPLTTGLLHADPGPSSFLVDASGQVAVIDWGAVTWGPLLYDVASPRICVEDDTAFHRFLGGYLRTAPLPEEELT